MSSSAYAGNAIDIGDLQASYAQASATLTGFQDIQIISAPTEITATDASGNKICSCSTTASGVASVSCQQKTVTYYTAILRFENIVADFPYLVKDGLSYLQEGDTGFSSIPGTRVYLTLPLGNVDPNGLGVTTALLDGSFTDVNKKIAQTFLNGSVGSLLQICQARMDIRVSDTDGSTHVTVVSGTLESSACTGFVH